LTANPLQKTVYAYDHRNRLFALSEFNSAGTNFKNVVYAYDVFNRRVIKGIDPDGGAPQYTYDYTYFVYDTDDIVLALKAGGVHSNRYLHGPAVDEVLADENTQNVLWPLRDQFYNIRDLVNHGSSHYNHIDYDAFGKVTYESNPAPAYLAHAYGFQSRERDQESGLNYHRNRYYNAAIGRWMSEDPIGCPHPLSEEKVDKSRTSHCKAAIINAKRIFGTSGDYASILFFPARRSCAPR
jgi:RHS repeat-associated protein